MTAIVDTGVVYALFDKTDAAHANAVKWLRAGPMEVVVPATILGEVGHFLEREPKARQSRVLTDWLLEDGLELQLVLPQDLRRMSNLMAKYPAIGFVDASIVAIAERLFIDTIATTDRRHFSAIRPAHVERFRLVP